MNDFTFSREKTSKSGQKKFPLHLKKFLWQNEVYKKEELSIIFSPGITFTLLFTLYCNPFNKCSAIRLLTVLPSVLHAPYKKKRRVHLNKKAI